MIIFTVPKFICVGNNLIVNFMKNFNGCSRAVSIIVIFCFTSVVPEVFYGQIFEN